MTFVQQFDSAHRSSSSGDSHNSSPEGNQVTDGLVAVRLPLDDLEHHANSEKTNMSSSGPERHPPLEHQAGASHTPHPRGRSFGNASTQTRGALPLHLSPLFSISTVPSAPITIKYTVKSQPRRRIYFVDLAEQLRIERYLRNRQVFLEGRKRVLQKIIALSTRLYRNSFFIRDGLAAILRSKESTCFKRVHQHAQNLVDVCYSRWNMELHALDTLDATDSIPAGPVNSSNFLSKLTPGSQRDLLILINCLRRDTKYLISRFKTLSHSQIAALSKRPAWRAVTESVLTSLQSEAHDSQRQKVLANNVKEFESHCLSFDRSNPLAFLLFNIYGTEHTSDGRESQLRLFTWSTVLADLVVTYHQAYQVLLPLLLNAFAIYHEWRVKEGVEIFLMDILQSGAFLLDSSGHHSGRRRKATPPPNTPQADAFFEDAVIRFFHILTQSDSGFPHGALQFVSALLDKMPTQQLQMDLRAQFLTEWFPDRFLGSAIVYPEEENMLLNFHVSDDARERILIPLHYKITEAVKSFGNPFALKPVHPDVQYCIQGMIGALDSVPAPDPYATLDLQQLSPSVTTSSVVVCAAEIHRILEALSPQIVHGSHQSELSLENFLTTSILAFRAQHPHNLDPFDGLKRELYYILEPGSSQLEVHPCDEKWLELEIDQKGTLQQKFASGSSHLRSSVHESSDLDSAQQAALALCKEYIATVSATESSTSCFPDVSKDRPLTALFKQSMMSSNARNNPVQQIFWEDATKCLENRYPLSGLIGDDTTVLNALMNNSKVAQSSLISGCADLEAETSVLEDVSSKMRGAVNTFLERFEELKVKLWYATDVMLSKEYESAKNITEALNNMVVPSIRVISSSHASIYSGKRPQSSQSAASSIFQQSVNEVLGMLKAPTDRGGPRKLADDQIEKTNKWLQETHVENFCVGEERIHRFCMEVSITAKAIVSESPDFSQSPTLWWSQLFSQEKSYYDTYTFGITSAPASTRPASVMSDGYAGSIRPSMSDARITTTLDRQSFGRRGAGSSIGYNKIDRPSLRPEQVSFIGSPGKASATTATAESISTFWSRSASHTKSMTSLSVYSRPPSTFNDTSYSRFLETATESTKFLNKIRNKLTCLLLSDLGRTVWSMGSETDAWLKSSNENPAVTRNLKQRIAREKLESTRADLPGQSSQDRPSLRRSLSVSSSSSKNHEIRSMLTSGDAVAFQPVGADMATQFDRYEDALAVLLENLKAYVDPMRKLQVIEDFHTISIAQITCAPNEKPSGVIPARRRNSFDIWNPNAADQKQNNKTSKEFRSSRKPSEQDIIAQILHNLRVLRPETLFRDLQYVAAFVPLASTDKTARGVAFFRLGIAAMAYKDEVVRSLVHVADSLVSKDLIKRPGHVDPPESTIAKAAEHWMLAAREGNAVAQRELAMLYLTYPHVMPVVTLPMSSTADIFRDEMQWHTKDDTTASLSSLCLAYHWMRLAARGDDLARRRLEERETQISIR